MRHVELPLPRAADGRIVPAVDAGEPNRSGNTEPARVEGRAQTMAVTVTETVTSVPHTRG
jgi:hypothetical protein